jgi:type III secretory pathway component EscU
MLVEREAKEVTGTPELSQKARDVHRSLEDLQVGREGGGTPRHS